MLQNDLPAAGKNLSVDPISKYPILPNFSVGLNRALA
jgi:hypothetical protein